MVDIENLRKLLAEATPGPWTLNDYGAAITADAGDVDVLYAADLHVDRENLILVVAAVNALPGLLVEVETGRCSWNKLWKAYNDDTKAAQERIAQLEADAERNNRETNMMIEGLHDQSIRIEQLKAALRKARDKVVAFIMREYSGESDAPEPDHPLEAVCQLMSAALDKEQAK